MKRHAIVAVWVVAFLFAPRVAFAACADLAQLSLPSTTITAATLVAAGTFKTGGQAGSHFAYASMLTEIPHVGNVAYRVGKKLEWDSASLKAKNCPEADRFIRREYRKGWSL